MPNVLRATSADKLDHLLDTSIIPQYITDNYGRLEYVNPALEIMLGYAPGEVIDSRLSIYHLFYQLKGEPVPDDYTLLNIMATPCCKKNKAGWWR